MAKITVTSILLAASLSLLAAERSSAQGLPLEIRNGLSVRNVQDGHPDTAPPGYEEWISPLVIPAKPQDGSQGWAEAIQRAKAFVAQLTVEEKVNLTTGVGTSGRCVGNTGTVPRLGFEGICLQDSPLGIRSTDFNSAFPAAINAAATWDRDLIHKRGVAMGNEFKGKGVNVALGPMTNLARVPAGGRNWEGWGADPWLSGVATAVTVKGMQSTGLSACVKHYVGNEQEHFRGGSGGTASSSNIADRPMHELYDWPFGEAVRAGVDYAMCSYNRINQTHACENSKILNGIMKGEADFQGVILSDWAATTTGVSAALAGLDMVMPGFTAYGVPDDQHDPSKATNSYWGAALVQSIHNGSVPEARLDDMVTRTMSAYYKQGQDQPSYPAVNFQTQFQATDEAQLTLNDHVNVQGDHYKLIREMGAASTVLLKNTKNTLPLPSPEKIKSIAIIGSDAGDNPDGPNGCQDRNCNQGTLAMGWGSGTANFPYLISPATAIQNYVHSQSPTTVINPVLSDFNYVAVTRAAAAADVTLVHVNSNSGEGYITVSGNAGDRNNLTLWNAGDQLIAQAASASDNVVVIIHSVGSVNLESWIENPNVTAVIYAGLPGQESGNAEVDILWGKVNPSARLPFTIGKKREDYPADVLYESNEEVPQITYSEELNIDYRWFDVKNITPRFEFGFGLSYTTFEYGNVAAKAVARKRHLGTVDRRQGEVAPTGANNAHGLYDDVIRVTYSLTNTGGYDGHEVSQLYLEFPESANEPPRVLRGFERTFLKQGETQTITHSLRRKDVSIWSVVKQQWEVPEGTFVAHVGSSSRKLHLKKSFTV